MYRQVLFVQPYGHVWRRTCNSPEAVLCRSIEPDWVLPLAGRAGRLLPGALMVAVLDLEVLWTTAGLLLATAAVAAEDSAACSWQGCLCLGDVVAEADAGTSPGMVLQQ